MRQVAVEMSADRAFSGRVKRLAVVSVFGLGAIVVLAGRTLDVSLAIQVALGAGWVLMPTILGFSLRRPAIRVLVFLPATLVGVGLMAICLTALPPDRVARVGWLATTAGIFLGGFLGGWFWYRWLPVPASLANPFSLGRWTLIAAHVTLVVGGLLLVALGRLV